MRPRYPLIWGLFAVTLGASFEVDCRKPLDPSDVDGGIVVVDTLCRYLQGVADGNVIAVCATVEEIAFILSVLAPLLLEHPPTKDECIHIPTTDRCATAEQIGYGIRRLIERRRSMLLLELTDGGT
jgi:hypothetical protein